MKNLVTILTFFLTYNAISQTCNCDTDSSLKEIINCDTIHFSNKSILYRNFNCDSSWLTFQNASGKKLLLYSLDAGLINLTERLGYQYATEYKSYFLIQNNVISGCCDPAEFILFDKETGAKNRNFGRLVFFSETPKYPIVAYFKNSNYKSFNSKLIDYNSIVVENVENKKIFKIQLPKKLIENTILSNQILFPEHLIEETKIENGILIIKYRCRPNRQKEWEIRIVKMNLENVTSSPKTDPF